MNSIIPPQSLEPEEQANALAILLQDLNAVRSLNAAPSSSNVPINAQLRGVHESAMAFVRTLQTAPVQVALRHAQELDGPSAATIALSREDEERLNPKRRKLASPSRTDSTISTARILPQYLAPATEDGTLILPALLQHIQQYRNAYAPKLRIQQWLSERGKEPLNSPVTLKVTVSDIFCVYLGMATDLGDNALEMRKTVAFGTREKRLPHMQSEYAIFRNLSQVLTKVIHETPGATLHQMLDLIATYDNLYVAICVVCGKHMSREGHLPPLERLWESSPSKSQSGPSGRWTAKHIGCQ